MHILNQIYRCSNSCCVENHTIHELYNCYRQVWIFTQAKKIFVGLRLLGSETRWGYHSLILRRSVNWLGGTFPGISSLGLKERSAGLGILNWPRWQKFWKLKLPICFQKGFCDLSGLREVQTAHFFSGAGLVSAAAKSLNYQRLAFFRVSRKRLTEKCGTNRRDSVHLYFRATQIFDGIKSTFFGMARGQAALSLRSDSTNMVRPLSEMKRCGRGSFTQRLFLQVPRAIH